MPEGVREVMPWWKYPLYAFLEFVCAFLRIRCDKPRLPPGTASMAPQVIRDRFEHLYCEKFRYHQGLCAAKKFSVDPRSEGGSREEIVSWKART